MDQFTIDYLIRRFRLAGHLGWLPGSPGRVRRRVVRRLIRQPAGAAALAGELTGALDEHSFTIARAALLTLTDQDVIDAVGRAWYDTLHHDDPDGSRLDEVIRQAGWVAARPAPVRALTALLCERTDLLADAPPELARALAEAADDERPPLSDRAREVLPALRRASARDAVCELAVDDGSPAALEAALGGSFMPSDEPRRAVLLFLAGDFERYAELDFDGTLLWSAYPFVHRSVRARLARQARAAGRVEWVRDVAVGRTPDRLAALTGDEWEATVAVLTGARQWPELWRLALAAPPQWSARMLRELGRSGWLPEDERERSGCVELIALAGRCSGDYPPAVAFARADDPALGMESRYIGRLAMSADGELLACSDHKTVSVWRPAAGELIGRYEVPGVGSMAISPDGERLALARQQKPGVFTDRVELEVRSVLSGAVISSWSDDAGHLVNHDLIMLASPDGRLMARPVDNAVQLWRLPSGEPAGRIQVGDGDSFVSGLAFSPDGSTLACAEGPRVRLLDLRSHELTSPLDLSDAHWRIDAIALAGDGSRLITADPYGSVKAWRLPGAEPEGTVIRPPAGEQRWHTPSLALMSDGTVIAADGVSRIRLRPPGERGTNLGAGSAGAVDLRMTADGTLIAAQVGGQVRLWRSELARLARTPVEQIDPGTLDKLANRKGLSGGAHRWLDLARALVQWRRRHDIEVVDGTTLVAGAADIEVDDS
jgi:WD40 repeat protein